MPSVAVQNPPAPAESKSARKKKAKAAADSPASPVTEKAGSANGDDSSENVYVRELQKNIRNVNKKLTNASKTDGLIAQHKDKSLDELVAAKIINADQRAQALKKPQLGAQLAQLEETLAQYKKVEEDYRARLQVDKTKYERELTEKLEKEKADATVAVTEKAVADAKQLQHDSLLVLSQFLRLAAARRSEDADQSLDENMALEGVLLNVYSGDDNAVATMLKLINGSDDKAISVSGEELQTTYGQVKAAAVSHVAVYASTEPETAPEGAEGAEAAAESAEHAVTDPTVAHAGLTEVDAAGGTATTNGNLETEPHAGLPINASVDDGAANAVAETTWDANNDMSASLSQEGWVKVPRDPTETDTGLAATPAADGPVQSWADEQPENAPETSVTPADDGFHQVQRNRPRGQAEGRGRGGRGGRGRGDGRGRGRGRGNFRGGRGARNAAES